MSAAEGLKVCRTCGVAKPLSAYNPDRSRRSDGTVRESPRRGVPATGLPPAALLAVLYARFTIVRHALQSRVCKDCGVEKPAGEFHRNGMSRDGLQSYCKPCQAVRSKRRAANLPPGHQRARMLKAYGLTVADFDRMAEAQGGGCSICGQVPTRLVVDHDHTTGRIRGLVCRPCNSGMGLFGDQLALLERALLYLRHGPPT